MDTWLDAHAFYGFLSFTAFGIDNSPAFFCMMDLGLVICFVAWMDGMDWKNY